MGSESLDMDEIWAVADLLKHAIIITRELDIESEAMALSRLGKLHYDVTKNEDKAVAYFKQGLVLAGSLHPIPMYKAWYQVITDSLAVLQQAITKRYDAEWQRKREPILKELKDDLDALNRVSNKSNKEFLTHLYTHHPPKNSSHKQPEHDPEAQKRILRTAIIHYHPDKAADTDDKWFVMCEEIVKLLTQKYEMFKG